MEQKELNQADLLALLSRVREGNNEAFEALCELYAPLLRNMIGRFLNPAAETYEAELTQEAKIALYNAAVTYSSADGSVTFGLYARICVYHALVSFKRKNGKELDVCSIDELTDVFAAQETEPSASLVSAERIAEIYQKAASVLSPFEKRIFDLYFLEEIATADMALMLGKDERSVRNALYRVRTKLKAAL